MLTEPCKVLRGDEDEVTLVGTLIRDSREVEMTGSSEEKYWSCSVG